MARIVKRTHSEPYELVVGGETKYICRCDSSHKLTKGEEAGKLYWYDDAGKRRETTDAFASIRTF